MKVRILGKISKTISLQNVWLYTWLKVLILSKIFKYEEALEDFVMPFDSSSSGCMKWIYL
jgi:hypothetical protein